VVAHISDIENRVPGDLALNREMPVLHVGRADVSIDVHVFVRDRGEIRGRGEAARIALRGRTIARREDRTRLADGFGRRLGDCELTT